LSIDYVPPTIYHLFWAHTNWTTPINMIYFNKVKDYNITYNLIQMQNDLYLNLKDCSDSAP